MTYTDVFGGNLIFPARVSYLAITTSVDVTLQWPTEQQITGSDVVADIIDTTTNAAGLNIDMPDARNTSLGNKATFNNIGGVNTFTVRDNLGGTIQSVAPGEQWVIVLTDNSTQAGTWTTFQLGGNAATQASASALAGDGLEADGIQLNQIIDSDEEAGTPFTVVDGDRAKCLIYTAGAGTCNLPSPGVVGNNWFFMLRNSGSGTLNVVPPSGDIDGSASLNLQTNDSAFIFTDGTDFFTIGLSSGSTIAFDFVSIAVPGSGDFVLSGANLDRISYRFTGALTGNRRIVVPNTTQQYWCDNQTSGSFTLEIDTAAGAGQFVPQGQSVIVYCDGTDVINATSSTSVSFPITIGQGGTGATTVSGAQINLQVPPDSRLVDTSAAGGLSGGGDLSSDRTHVIALASVPTATPDIAADFFLFQDADDTDLTKKALLNTVTGLTVEDEGVPLATSADTLDFVGGFVTASGAGASKTITIGAPLQLLDSEEIQFGTGNDVQMLFDGTDMFIDCDGVQLILRNSSAAALQEFIVQNSNRGIGMRMEASATASSICDYLSGGTFVKEYIQMDSSTGVVALTFGGVPVIESQAVTGTYPYATAGGGCIINNNTTGNGDSRALTFYDHQQAGASGNLARNLTTTLAEDDRLTSTNGPGLRQGWYKFECFIIFEKLGVATDAVCDFDGGTNLSDCHYIGDYRSEDGAPSGNFAGDDSAVDFTISLPTSGEDVMVRITGNFQITSNGGSFFLRWAPSTSTIDVVQRLAGSWLTICPLEIGV